MTEKLLENIHEYASKATAIADELKKFGELKIDHVDILTKSLDDYNQVLSAFNTISEKIIEIPHAGRMITVVKLNKPIKINEELTISTIEISEPKPKRTVTETGIDHISFIPKEFSKFADALNENVYEVYDFKTIAKTKLFKLKLNDIKFEFRDRSILEASSTQQDEPEETKSNDLSEEQALLSERAAKLRAIADYQNLKRQVQEEREHFITLANAALLQKLLDLLDDFDRSLESDTKSEGIKMIRDKLYNLIHEFGLQEVTVNIGDKLDPTHHQVIGSIAVSGKEEVNTIKQVVQKGYTFKHNDQLVRPVRVIVGKKE